MSTFISYNSLNPKKGLTFLLISIVLLACSKEKSKRSMNPAHIQNSLIPSIQDEKKPNDSFNVESEAFNDDSLWDQAEKPLIPKIKVDFEKYGFVIACKNQKYSEIKTKILNKRKLLNQEIKKGTITKDSVYQYFQKTLINNLIPHWYGTSWTFEGHTNTPQKGSIACGYFVSTTLKHMGLNVNRYHLAQQSALNEAKSLSSSDTIFYYLSKTPEYVISDVKKNLKEGVYMVGLDFHVGYLVFQKGEVFFIHSSYFYPVEVVIELAFQSDAFRNSDNYFISRISHNDEFINKWLNEEEIVVIRD